MAEVRYVCLSDLHFGQETSLLTNLATASTVTDPTEASPALKGLVDCLKRHSAGFRAEKRETHSHSQRRRARPRPESAQRGCYGI